MLKMVVSLGVTLSVFSVLSFLWEKFKRNNLPSKLFFGVGLILVALISYFGAEAETLRKVLVTGAAIIFGVYAIFRAFSEVGNLNSATPPSIIGHFNKILMLFLAALPVIFINVSGGSIEFVFLDFTGLALFAIGFFLEIRGSKFGQPLIWIGFFLLSLSVPYGFVSAASTLLVLVFLLKYKMFPAIAI